MTDCSLPAKVYAVANLGLLRDARQSPDTTRRLGNKEGGHPGVMLVCDVTSGIKPEVMSWLWGHHSMVWQILDDVMTLLLVSARGDIVHQCDTGVPTPFFVLLTFEVPVGHRGGDCWKVFYQSILIFVFI